MFDKLLTGVQACAQAGALSQITPNYHVTIMECLQTLRTLSTLSHLLLTTPCIGFIIPISQIGKLRLSGVKKFSKDGTKGFLSESAYRKSECSPGVRRCSHRHLLNSCLQYLNYLLHTSRTATLSYSDLASSREPYFTPAVSILANTVTKCTVFRVPRDTMQHGTAHSHRLGLLVQGLLHTFWRALCGHQG